MIGTEALEHNDGNKIAGTKNWNIPITDAVKNLV